MPRLTVRQSNGTTSIWNETWTNPHNKYFDVIFHNDSLAVTNGDKIYVQTHKTHHFCTSEIAFTLQSQSSAAVVGFFGEDKEINIPQSTKKNEIKVTIESFIYISWRRMCICWHA